MGTAEPGHVPVTAATTGGPLSQLDTPPAVLPRATVRRLRRRDRQSARLLAAFAGLAVVWGVAFNVGLPFFPVIVAGGVLTGAAGLWVRRAPDEPDPPFTLTRRQTALALGVAAVHFALGHALFRLGALLLPGITSSAAEVYERSGSLPVWGQLLLGAVVTASLEEVFWRGAWTPMVAARLQGLGSGWSRDARVVLASTVGYALFHVATLKLALVAAAALGGLFWGLLYVRTRSVGPPLVAHVTWTALMILFPPV